MTVLAPSEGEDPSDEDEPSDSAGEEGKEAGVHEAEIAAGVK